MSAHSCSLALRKVSGTLCFALAQPKRALTTQPRSAVASAVLQTIMGNILSLGNEAAWTHTLLQLWAGTVPSTQTGPGTGWQWLLQIPRKGFQCIDKGWPYWYKFVCILPVYLILSQIKEKHVVLIQSHSPLSGYCVPAQLFSPGQLQTTLLCDVSQNG